VSWAAETTSAGLAPHRPGYLLGMVSHRVPSRCRLRAPWVSVVLLMVLSAVAMPIALAVAASGAFAALTLITGGW